MTKAEEAALKAYPLYWAKAELPNGSTIDFDSNETTRCVYKRGYSQAEKDLGWHPASEHPPVDEEVIVLTDALGVAPYYEIAVGHIVNIDCVDFNGWNIRGVVWWMPMPKIPNEK